MFTTGLSQALTFTESRGGHSYFPCDSLGGWLVTAAAARQSVPLPERCAGTLYTANSSPGTKDAPITMPPNTVQNSQGTQPLGQSTRERGTRPRQEQGPSQGPRVRSRLRELSFPWAECPELGVTAYGDSRAMRVQVETLK